MSKPIELLPPADPLTGDELVHVVQAGNSRQAPVSLFGSSVVTPQMFGAVGDDVTDDGPAFLAALAYLATLKMNPQVGYGQGTPKLFIPASVKPYYLSNHTLDITNSMILQGESGNTSGGSVLRWANGTTGIRLQSYNTAGGSGGPVVTAYQGASGSIVERLTLIGGYAGGAESESHGIHLRVLATVRDVLVANFAGDGIHVNTAALSVTNAGNSNGSRIDNVFAQGCRTGIYIEQFDANAFKIDQPYTIINRRYGIWTLDTLGMTIDGGLSETNGLTVGFPTMCSYLGNRYYCLPNQEVWANANAPSGTTANNTGWGYSGAGGATADIPAWSAAMGVRAGGGLRIEGNFQACTVTGWYYEPGQPPAQLTDAAATLWLSPMGGYPRNFAGEVSGHGLYASGAGFSTTRGLRVGRSDLGVPLSGCGLDVDGDIRLTRPGVNYSPQLICNATGPGTGSYIRFWHDGGGDSLILGLNGDLYYQTDTNADLHIFNCGNGNTIATIDNTGLLLSAGKVLKVNGNQVVGARGAAVADAAAMTSVDATNAVAAPTQAEFNAFVAEFNKLRTDHGSVLAQLNALLARVRAATGHGLIA